MWVELWSLLLMGFFINLCCAFIKTNELDQEVVCTLSSKGHFKGYLRRLSNWKSINSCTDRGDRYALNSVFVGERKDRLVAAGEKFSLSSSPIPISWPNSVNDISAW